LNHSGRPDGIASREEDCCLPIYAERVSVLLVLGEPEP